MKRGRQEDVVESATDDAIVNVSLEALAAFDFEEIARRYPDFGRAYAHVYETFREKKVPFASAVTQDFTITLLKAILHHYFSLSLAVVPLNNLCPPVPNRYFFVRWMYDTLLSSTPPRAAILDIGTGPVCIYPLLMAKTIPNTRIHATDVDVVSIQQASENVEANGLQYKISLHHVGGSSRQVGQMPHRGPLQVSLESINEHVAVCMTNPPFYDPSESLTRRDGRSRTNMSQYESVYPGGEVRFVLDMVIDCLGRVAKRCYVPLCASMCGRKATLEKLLPIVRQCGFRTWATEFGPGNTTRWFIAWALFPSPADEDSWSFELSEISELTSRLQEFAKDQRTLSCLLHGDRIILRETTPFQDRVLPGDEILPDEVCNALYALTPQERVAMFLPSNGHFYLEILPSFTTVQIKSFSFSMYGRRRVGSLKAQLRGEIKRTNRKWRRKKIREDTMDD